MNDPKSRSAGFHFMELYWGSLQAEPQSNSSPALSIGKAFCKIQHTPILRHSSPLEKKP